MIAVRVGIVLVMVATAVTVCRVADSATRQEERRDAWGQVIADLDQKRSIAWQQLDPALLSLAYQVSSEPFKADQATMQTYANEGVVSAQGVSTPVSWLEVRSEGDDRVVLEVLSRVRPYVVTYENGKRFRVEPKEPARRLRITLVPDGSGGWLMSGTSEVE